MLRRVEFVANRVQDEGVPPDGPAAPSPRPAGALEALLDHGPAFRGSVRGYDRVQVDNYVAWAENELAAAQREREHLLDRVVACGTELEISRRLLAEQPVGRERPAVSARVGEVLRLAEDQAAQVLDAAEAEAAQLRADARLEADARLRKAHEIKELAIEVADQLRVNAQRDRAEGVAALEQARAEAEEMLRAAAAERDRLAAEAAAERDRLAAEAAAELERAEEQARRDRAAADDAAGAHLAALRTEIEDLWRQRDQARESLRCLTDRIGAALQAVGVPPAEELALLGGRAEPVTG
ncbi:DivIVA domain-containing protein [Blastococcus sp. SYSU DS0541]